MPKVTFHNLNNKKKDKILAALREEFEEKSIFEANVSNIIRRAEISRGSFYQYFEDLEDSFFTILDLELVEVHDIFTNLVIKEDGDIIRALENFGPLAASEIYRKGNYNLYKNRYIYWTCQLDEKWKKFRQKGLDGKTEKPFYLKDRVKDQNMEAIYFIKSVIKSLLERLFYEAWTEEEFLKKYRRHIDWIESGVKIKE